MPEEKGPFGKASRRFGSSRATRTQTPAKKENPTLDGFETAWKKDQTDRKSKISSTTAGNAPSAVDSTQQSLPALTKEPHQLLLYGFSSETQWAAISFYESVSGGLVCEDYPRDPPAEKRRFYNGLATPSNSTRRPLTAAELALSTQYHGGASWIVVTLDSRDAAERAVAASPHIVQGHLVAAEPWRGIGPAEDRPILATEEERRARIENTGGATWPNRRRASVGRQSNTLPRDFASRGEERNTGALVPFNGIDGDEEALSIESTTLSSATALGSDDLSSVRLRHAGLLPPSPTKDQDNSTTLSGDQSSPPREGALATRASRGTHFTHFPDVPRTALKPASEALLPQTGWWEGVLASLTKAGLIPGDMIGAAVPRTESGDFDYEASSVYWRVCFWVDWFLGWDLCGLKET